MFHKSAAFYDAIYRDRKDYAAEARRLDYLLGKRVPRPTRLLDVGCGTGEHALQLVKLRPYDVDGIDIEAEFIRLARTKLPRSRFELADMRDFQLNRCYDALLCLFSSIGYVETLEGLQATAHCFRKHLNAGGWVVCEPWISPEEWREGQIDVTAARDPDSGAQIVRSRQGETDGRVSVLQIDYEVELAERTVNLHETHRLGLFTSMEIETAFANAGFRCLWAETGLQLNRLLVATAV
ncbi:class I SAM-dependent methyltransferase [Pelagicoccus sp. SDUM812003]|uniref:class I SAM-dependent methyltransferase n=1 Tax=Pelagicoccus sp. SDUM812003 TaxID=3041267 RepID=UPI002810671C|nr:class I SAM-dependent methyltransferase [Pelagicoccus sp. SDUM812003]MDQ8202752.1 class I SAM-dependent methyltransferase [Pelagicoccus sp. SDUM812003]